MLDKNIEGTRTNHLILDISKIGLSGVSITGEKKKYLCWTPQYVLNVDCLKVFLLIIFKKFI